MKKVYKGIVIHEPVNRIVYSQKEDGSLRPETNIHDIRIDTGKELIFLGAEFAYIWKDKNVKITIEEIGLKEQS